MISIISNLSAGRASANLAVADAQTSRSIASLSSGKRIIKASDDVAGLAVGTVMQTNVTALKAALLNTAQAASLLGVADGGLSQIADLLRRQKTLSSQAMSGTLSDVDRGFLNLEFQSLMQEIDRLSAAVNFNNINLLDGSLYNPKKITTDTTVNSISAAGTLSFGLTTGFAAPVTGDTLTLDLDGAGTAFAATDVVFRFVDSTSATSGTSSLMELNVSVNTTATALASALVDKINLIKTYSGTDTTVLLAKSRLNMFDITLANSSVSGGSQADSLLFSHKTGGTLGNSVTFGGTNATSNFALNAANLASGTNDTLTVLGGTVGTNGSLHGGLAATSTKTYQTTTAQYFKQGSIGDSIINAIRVSEISNNSGFLGVVSGFKAHFVESQVVDLSVKIGQHTYRANGVNTNYTGSTDVTFQSELSGGGSFIATFAAAQMPTMHNQQDADTFASRLDKAFSTMVMMQKREVTNFQGIGSVYPTGSNTASGNLTGSKVYYVGNTFTNIEIEDVKVSAPATSSNDYIIEITVNGDVYRSGYDYDGSTALAPSAYTTPNVLDNNAGSNGGQVGFVNAKDPTKYLILKYASATGLSITNLAEAQGAQKALKAAFGIGDAKGGDAGLNFQVGTASTDIINVQIPSAKSKELYRDDLGNDFTASIGTQPTAQATNHIVDLAIKSLISIRATVGALQSRMDYASANITSSMENQDAARGVFLDTDVAEESTQLAQSQVRLQASISVLAQANQIPQTLLKLLG